MKMKKRIYIDNIETTVNDERNLLEVIRAAGIDIPTFCYHSEISIYGACRLCMVEVEGKGLVPSCSTIPEDGMRVRTNTAEIRKMRKMIVELTLASHDMSCPTCAKSADCKLQDLARRMGVDEVRFKKRAPKKPIDRASESLVRDPNKCVLCGDCVRVCDEVQGIGAIDFAFRGSESTVTPCFGKNLDKVECVYCGQCVRVCPTGAILPKSHISEVWEAINDPELTVVAQLAPAVRVAIGESFGLEPGTNSTGQIVAALRKMGFDRVYDTSFAADLTILEETNEFLGRIENGNKMPMFTSCCPGWVKFAEQYYPEYLDNISTCASPQQMFGSLCKKTYQRSGAKSAEKLRVVSIMPCTAKKFEAARPEFTKEYGRDVDYVLTTRELALMIEESGLRFPSLAPDSFDMPFGFKTGGGVIFGSSGGVTEAVLRYAVEKVTGETNFGYVFESVRGNKGIKSAIVDLSGNKLRFGIVMGLGNARKLMESIKSGEEHYDFVEVMACPGGCVGGGGQPVPENMETTVRRSRGLYENDRMLQLHKSQENPYVSELYDKLLVSPNSHMAHELLHTSYKPRQRTEGDDVSILSGQADDRTEITFCFGTGCFVKGAQELLKETVDFIREADIADSFDIKATFCHENCSRGPVVDFDGEMIEKCTFEKIVSRMSAVRAGKE